MRELTATEGKRIAEAMYPTMRVRSVGLIPIEKAQPGCEIYIPHRFRGPK